MFRSLLATSLVFLLASTAAAQSVSGLRVPSGFEVTEFADHTLANDIYTMTVDPRGRIVVAGRGYIRVLLDDNGDRKAERVIEFADSPRDGAMGLHWEKDTLYVTGDGGLRRFLDRDGDGKADGPSERIRTLKTGGEHTAHAIRRGPDGWLYVLCGNTTGIDRTYATTPASPIKEPVAGCVLRFSPDLKQSEIVAHGFRNAYGMDFNLNGDLFTFDSDNERCVGLPWYEPTRFNHVIEGRFHGWLSPQRADFWRMPPYFLDVVPPLATLGRGSPTGVVCYRHTQFPKEYQGGLFLLDWTFGKVHFAALKQAGSTYTCQTKVFMESTGDNGFAPTAAVVHPTTGDLFVSIGGRGTRGGVYRVRYREAPKDGLKELPVVKRKPSEGPSDSLIVRALAATKDDPNLAIELAAPLLSSKDSHRQRDAIRILQLALGDIGARSKRGTIWEGYTRGRDAFPAKLAAPAARRDLAATLLQHCFGDDIVRREAMRLVAMMEADCDLDLVLSKIHRDDPAEAIHGLAVFACLPGPRGREVHSHPTAKLLFDLEGLYLSRKVQRESNWPLRIRELVQGLCEKDPLLLRAIVDAPEFGKPEHAVFTLAKGFDRKKAAAAFLASIKRDKDYRLNDLVVGLLAELPPSDVLGVLRPRWGTTGVETSLLPLLAKESHAEDRPKFIGGLASSNPTVLSTCLDALEQLPGQDDGSEAMALIRTLGTLPDKSEGRELLRIRVVQRLTSVTGQKFGSDKQAWTKWFASAHPDKAVRLTNPDGVDVQAWAKRLGKIDWSGGDATRGRAAFVKASCVHCHSGTTSLGPDLAGVTGRFSRDDLFTAIVQPSRDVPARYQSTFVETHDGKIYQGLVIYDAFDSLILQTGPATTARLAGEQIAARRVVAQSLMPAALLDPLTDRDVADLYAYLKTLSPAAK